MTEMRYAIRATIPTGDPHSRERREWCKAAAEAIAQVCLDHAREDPRDRTPATIAFACDGVRAAYEESMNFLRREASVR